MDYIKTEKSVSSVWWNWGSEQTKFRWIVVFYFSPQIPLPSRGRRGHSNEYCNALWKTQREWVIPGFKSACNAWGESWQSSYHAALRSYFGTQVLSWLCHHIIFKDLFLFFLYIGVYMSVWHLCMGAHRCQKRAAEPWELELHAIVSPVCGCWKLNSGSVEEELWTFLTLTAEPSFQPPPMFFTRYGLVMPVQSQTIEANSKSNP